MPSSPVRTRRRAVHDRFRMLRLILPLLALLTIALLASGCPSPDAEPAPTPTKTQQPTFTPPPPTSTSLPLEPSASESSRSVEAPAEVAVGEATDTPAPIATAEPPTPLPTDTPPPKPRLRVSGDNVNVRSGPGTNYTRIGSVAAGQEYDVVGVNPAGDWWQICCVSGRDVWIVGSLTQVAHGELVQVAQNIPAPPPTRVPPTAAPPTAAPPPPAANPCAGIGGDGCKFRVTGGPKTAPNNGMELKLQFFFIHSGVKGGQPQGSYFVWMEKDGVKLPISDAVRSVANAYNEGNLGRNNYEYKVGLDQLPGNTVAGNYLLWVLDGNGERDSQNVTFSVPAGQGELWIQFDQN